MIIKKTYKEFIPINNKNYRIIVGLTSWKKRINVLEPTIKSICEQIRTPDIFYLVLSKKEFPNLNADLPKYIFDYMEKYKFFRIEWVDKNIKQFKKNLPLLEKYWGQDEVLIFTADDDIYYRPNYICDLYKVFLSLNENTVITYNFRWPLENPINDGSIDKKHVIGKFEILCPTFFNNKIVLDITEDDVNSKYWYSEDWWITYNLLQNGKLHWYFLEYDFLFNRICFLKQNEIEPLENKWKDVDDEIKLNNIINLYDKKISRRI